jgi:DNA ligase-4
MDYKVNERGFPWVKVKADYLDGFTDTLDLIIIGGYYTEGHQGKIS